MSQAAANPAPIVVQRSLTLVGRDGRYDLIRNGNATGRPSLVGLSIDQIEALLQSVKGQRS